LDEDLTGGELYVGLYASVVIPSLNVGTVGGGVGLATQKECLKLIGCNGKVSKGSCNSQINIIAILYMTNGVKAEV